MAEFRFRSCERGRSGGISVAIVLRTVTTEAVCLLSVENKSEKSDRIAWRYGEALGDWNFRRGFSSLSQRCQLRANHSGTEYIALKMLYSDIRSVSW